MDAVHHHETSLLMQRSSRAQCYLSGSALLFFPSLSMQYSLEGNCYIQAILKEWRVIFQPFQDRLSINLEDLANYLDNVQVLCVFFKKTGFCPIASISFVQNKSIL